MSKQTTNRRLAALERDVQIENEAFKREMTKQVRKADLSAEQHRARSITVGTAFGGTTEIMMRKFDASVTWAYLQPVEVIELIHQLAANVGCHIALKPRDDFASWRAWKPPTEEERKHLNRHPPFVSDMGPHEGRAKTLPKPEEQPGLQPALFAKDEQNETMAIKKPKNRRSVKRPTATA